MHTLELVGWVEKGLWPYPYPIYEMEYRDASLLNMALHEKGVVEHAENKKVKKSMDMM